MSTIFARPSNENSSRCIERHVLAPVESSNTQLQDPAIKFTNLNVFPTKPYVALLFVAPGMYWGREENHKLEQEVAAAYGRHVGGRLIAVGCNECLAERGDSLRSCAGPRGPATGTPALLFWPSDGLRVRLSHDDVARHRYTSGERRYLVPGYVEGLVAELGLDDGDESALLVFANAFPSFIPATACLFNAIQSRCRGKKTSVWGGYFNDDVSVAERTAAGGCQVAGALFVLIRLTGAGLDSASTVVRCDRSRPEVDEQLRRFKGRLRPRRRGVLLMSGPVDVDAGADGYANCREFQAAAARIFDDRGLQLLGAFSNVPHAIGVESWTHENNVEQRYLRHNCMSLMALTYD